MSLLDRIPWGFIIVLCVALGLAPFFQTPHLIEKLDMLFSGTLTKPIDWFDLFFHASPFVLLGAKAVRHRTQTSVSIPES